MRAFLGVGPNVAGFQCRKCLLSSNGITARIGVNHLYPEGTLAQTRTARNRGAESVACPPASFKRLRGSSSGETIAFLLRHAFANGCVDGMPLAGDYVLAPVGRNRN